MLFLSSTAFIFMWFDISIFIFLKFILGEPINITSNDVDGITHTGVYRITNCANNPFGSNSTAILYVTKFTEVTNIFIRQVAVMVTSGVEDCKIRWYWASTGWTAWKDDAIDYPTFYKDYANLSSLASALRGVVQEISTTEDLNSLAGGLYSTSSGLQEQINAPFGKEAFSMVVIGFADDRTLQIAIRDSRVKYRIKWGTWKQWYEVSIF